MYRHIVKPFFDRAVAFALLLLALPVLLFTSLLLCFANRGKPFFVQERPGLQGRIFRIVKFKTMTDQRDTYGNLLSDAERLTRIGKFVRKTSIDELPQLLNVLRGEMSLIGPRPLLTSYLPLYNDFQRRRHEVKPGITGWAQVNGRNQVSWDERFAHDVFYVDHISFWLDLKILCLTVMKGVKSEGISQQGQATMEVFKGNHSG